MEEKKEGGAEEELRLLKALKAEREESNRTYAIKLVEKVVFALVAMLLVGVVGALLRLVIIQ